MRIAIIGGGAAGMMCAATINEQNSDMEVFLIEKNESLGKKVIISGGGRCNVTTGINDIKTVLKKYPRGEKFLISPMHQFPPEAVYTWFEQHGVPLKCEKDLRVFPQSDNGEDVVKAFEKIFAKYHTKVLLQHNVQNIKKADSPKTGFTIEFKVGEPLYADKVVLCVGGQAYRHTGSTGDGYTFAEGLGHHITPLAASLNSFITQEKWVKGISGVSFEKATIGSDRKKQYAFTGPFLFTHLGISGPAVFALSSFVAFEDYGPKNPLSLFIDFIPDIVPEEFTKQFLSLVQTNHKKTFKNILHTYVPESVAEVICTQLQIPLEKKNAEVTKEQIVAGVKWLKSMPLNAIGRGAGDEFVTAGGVELSEVDPKTMQSKICPGVYFAGEILNVDGFTGGFNLQASWATGYSAGKSIAQE
jgi:predicted Rossmann fold flavoprotein